MPDSWHVRTAKVDITPPVGMVGSYRRAHDGRSLGIHDPLYARIIVLDDGKTKSAVVGLDWIGAFKEFTGQVRRLVRQNTGIEHLMVGCSHTHSSPNTITLGDWVDGYEPISRSWLKEMAEKIADGVTEAVRNLRPARLAWGRGQLDISYNRFEVWKGREGGALDRDVNVLYVEDEDGSPVGLLVNYTCHAVVMMDVGFLTSSDFPGFAMEQLQQELGCVAVFTNGTQGNVNPQYVSRSYKEVESLGTALVNEVLRIRQEVATSPSLAPLVASHTDLFLPFREFPRLDQAQRQVEALRSQAGGSVTGHADRAKENELWRAERVLTLIEHYQGCTGLVTEVQAIRVGDRVLVSIPGEMFVDWGLQLKSLAKEKLGEELILVGLGNDMVGYIPSRQAFEEGCYETTLWAFSKLVPEAGQMIVDAAFDLVSGLPKT